MSSYFTVARDVYCESCGELILSGEEALYDADGVLCGYECGCGDPYYADW